MTQYFWECNINPRSEPSRGRRDFLFPADLDGCDSNLSLPEEQLGRIDLLFDQVAAKISPSLFLILTDRPAYEVAKYVYIFFEPFGSLNYTGVVIALSYTEKTVSVHADRDLWTPFFSDGCDAMIKQAEDLLRKGLLIEALICSLTYLPQC